MRKRQRDRQKRLYLLYIYIYGCRSTYLRRCVIKGHQIKNYNFLCVVSSTRILASKTKSQAYMCHAHLHRSKSIIGIKREKE